MQLPLLLSAPRTTLARQATLGERARSVSSPPASHQKATARSTNIQLDLPPFALCKNETNYIFENGKKKGFVRTTYRRYDSANDGALSGDRTNGRKIGRVVV